MKLTANVITNGRYYKAGTDVPDDLLSDAMRRYAVSDVPQQRRDADAIESKPAPRRRMSKAASFVKRNGEFVSSSTVKLIAKEKLFWHRKKSFGVDERWIAFSRVGNEA
jgi:hypothetical protein